MTARNKDLRQLRGCNDRKMRQVLREAMKALPYRMSKSGVVFYGKDGGMVSIHLTTSDHRATENALARLRAIGFEPHKKGH